MSRRHNCNWEAVFARDRFLADLAERGLKLALTVDGRGIRLATGCAADLTPSDRIAIEKYKVAIVRQLRDADRRAQGETGCLDDRRAAIQRASESVDWERPGGLAACVRCRGGTVWARRGEPLHPYCAPEGEP